MAHAHMQQMIRTACQTRRGQRTGQGRRAGQEGLLGPFDGSAAEHIDTVRQGMTLAGVAVPSSKHDGLNATIKLRQCHLHHQTVPQSLGMRSGLQKLLLGMELEPVGAMRQKLVAVNNEQHRFQLCPSSSMQ